MFDRTETYDYYQCPQCSAVYQQPMPDPEVIASFYPDTYSVYHQEKQPKQPRDAEKAVLKVKYRYHHLQVPTIYRLLAPIVGALFYRDGISYQSNGRALDVGCANGRFMRSLEVIGWHCEGVDFNINAVNTCRSQGLKVHHGSLESANLDPCSFDLITARHVIEHFPDPNSFIKEASRVLRHGGQLLIMTPNSRALGRKWFGKYWFADEVPRHLVLFSPSNLDMLAARHGLKRVTLKLNTTPKIILNSVDYRIANRGRPSRRIRWRRLLAKIYVFMANLSRRGDEIYAIYEKP